MPTPPKSSKTERVYVAATKASPATDEPVKRTATKTPAKKAPAAKTTNGTRPPSGPPRPHARPSRESGRRTARTPLPRAVKRAPRAKAADAPGTRAKKGELDADGSTSPTTSRPATTLEAEPEELVDEADLELEDLDADDEPTRRGRRRRPTARRRQPPPQGRSRKAAAEAADDGHRRADG